MTWEQYWYESPYIAVIYRKKHNLNIESDSQKMWLQGRYIFEAFDSVMQSYMRGLSIDKNHQPIPYTEEPYRLTPMSEEERAEKEHEEQKRKAKELEKRLLSFEAAWKRKHGDNEE
jgi:hypothetical protein